MKQQIIDYAKEAIATYPQFKEKILGILQLCLDEIEQGGSPQHEIELAINDIDQLIESDIED